MDLENNVIDLGLGLGLKGLSSFDITAKDLDADVTQNSKDMYVLYTFIHHEGSAVYIQSKTDRK